MPRRDDLESVYKNHAQQLFTCALAVTRCRDLAADAVHDAFCRLLKSATTPENLKAFVFRSVRNAAVDLVRRQITSIPLDEEYIFDPAPDPQRSASSVEFDRRLAQALLNLSPDERETVVQHLYAGIPLREVADIRDLSANTVKSWYRRGIEKLRSQLEEYK